MANPNTSYPLILTRLAAFATILTYSCAVLAQTKPVSQDPLKALARANPKEAHALAREVEFHWENAGSPTRNLLYQQGMRAAERGDTALSIAHFSALIDHAPKFAHGYYQRAFIYLRQGKIGLAQADLGTCLSLQPLHYLAILSLGEVFETFGDGARAERLYQMGLAIHPHHSALNKALQRVVAHKRDVAL